MTTTTTTKEAAPLASVEAEMERTMNEMDALSAQASQITERYAQLQVALTALTVRRAELPNISPRMACLPQGAGCVQSLQHSCADAISEPVCYIGTGWRQIEASCSTEHLSSLKRWRSGCKRH